MYSFQCSSMKSTDTVDAIPNRRASQLLLATVLSSTVKICIAFFYEIWSQKQSYPRFEFG